MNYPATASGAFGIVKSNDIVQTLRYSDFLLGNQQFGRYVNLFSQYRIRGAALEIMGVPRNMSDGDIANANSIVSGVGLDIMPLTFNDAMQANYSMTVNPIGKSRKYIPFSYDLKNWYNVVDAPAGGLFAYANGSDGTQLDSPSFTYKLTLYLIFRSSKL